MKKLKMDLAAPATTLATLLSLFLAGPAAFGAPSFQDEEKKDEAAKGDDDDA